VFRDEQQIKMKEIGKRFMKKRKGMGFIWPEEKNEKQMT
jgi:hypothetical protein